NVSLLRQGWKKIPQAGVWWWEPVYQACLTKVQKVLYRKLTKASEGADADFYAFSFYYDRAVDLGVIGKVRDTTALLLACRGETAPPGCMDGHHSFS
ncbi:hypothetical protein XENOCAPTIV_022052, partial [Xenoophorus captivus]